jgi:hypothetical protein
MTTMLVSGDAGCVGFNVVSVAMAWTDARVVIDKPTHVGNLLSLSGLLDSPRLSMILLPESDRPSVGISNADAGVLRRRLGRVGGVWASRLQAEGAWMTETIPPRARFRGHASSGRTR